jgi:hypothetical protein
MGKSRGGSREKRPGEPQTHTYGKAPEERRDNEQFSESLSRHHLYRYIGGIVLVVLVAALVWYWFFYPLTRPYSVVQERWSQEIVTVTGQQYTPFSDGILQYSGNGATFYNESSKMVWSASYEMKNPAAAVQGDYALVYDQGDKTAVILSAEEGLIGNILTELSITKGTISAYGVTALLVEEDLANNMLFYDKLGGQLEIKVKTLMNESGYPMDMSFSPDGQMMIASFVYIDSGVMQNRIVFYSFDTDRNTSTHAVAAFQQYGDTLFADVAFLGNERAAAFGDGKIVLYSLKKRTDPQELTVIEPEGKITNLAYDEDHIAYATTNGDLVQSRLLYLYNTDGTRIFDTETTFEFSEMNLGEEGLYLTGSSSVQYLNLKGKVCFTGSLDCNILELVSGKKPSEFLVVTNQMLKYLKLVRK